MTLNLQTPYLRALAIGSTPNDGLREGIHLRWHVHPKVGLPPKGFSVYRRVHVKADPICSSFPLGASPQVTIPYGEGFILEFDEALLNETLKKFPQASNDLQSFIEYYDDYFTLRLSKPATLVQIKGEGSIVVHAFDQSIQVDRSKRSGSQPYEIEMVQGFISHLRIRLLKGFIHTTCVAYAEKEAIHFNQATGGWRHIDSVGLTCDKSELKKRFLSGIPSNMSHSSSTLVKWKQYEQNVSGVTPLIKSVLQSNGKLKKVTEGDRSSSSGSSDIKNSLEIYPSHLLCTAAVDAPIARMLALAYVDTQVTQGIIYDYLILCSLFTENGYEDVGWIVSEVSLGVAPAIPNIELYDPFIEHSENDQFFIGLNFSKPVDIKNWGNPVLYHLKHGFENNQKTLLTQDEPILLDRKQQKFCYLDKQVKEGLHRYNVLGQDIFGRQTPWSLEKTIKLRDDHLPPSPLLIDAKYLWRPADLNQFLNQEDLVWLERFQKDGVRVEFKWTKALDDQTSNVDSFEVLMDYQSTSLSQVGSSWKGLWKIPYQGPIKGIIEGVNVIQQEKEIRIKPIHSYSLKYLMKGVVYNSSGGAASVLKPPLSSSGFVTIRVPKETRGFKPGQEVQYYPDFSMTDAYTLKLASNEFVKKAYIAVRAIRKTKLQSGPSTPHEIVNVRTTAPKKPGEFNLKSLLASEPNFYGKSFFELTWLPSPTPGAFYHVYRALDASLIEEDKTMTQEKWDAMEGSQKQKKANDDKLWEAFVCLTKEPIKQTSFKDTNLEGRSLNQYFYRVRAMSPSGILGNPGKSTPPVSIPDVTPPPAPIIQKLSGKSGKVSLSWMPASSKSLKGYSVYRTVDPNKADDFRFMECFTGSSWELAYQASQTKIFTSTTIKFEDPMPIYGKKVYYSVVAINPSGFKSSPSKIRSVLTFNPSPPLAPKYKEVKYNSQENSVVLKWTAAEEHKSFLVYRLEGGLKEWVKVSSWIEETEFKDSDIERGVTYTYRLLVISTSGLKNETFINKKIKIPT